MTDTSVESSTPQTRATLSRDLADFLIELSISINKYAMYPGGHPSLRPAVERVVRRLDSLLVEREMLSLGVARRQLVIEGVATEPKNPVLSDLAARLHRHQLGAITFRRGTDPSELLDMLAMIAVEADRSGQPLGLEPAEVLTQWTHLRLYPLTYERLELVQEGGRHEEDEGPDEARTHAAQLWIGLAQAALAAEDVDESTPVQTDPNAIAKAIDEHQGGSAYDQVIVGYMLQIAQELRTGQGHEGVELKRRMSRLVTSLDQDTLERLLDMGGDRMQRRRFLLDASQGLAVDAVVDLVQAASESQNQGVSQSMLRMLQKLAQHADVGQGRRRAVAEDNARAQIGQLIKGWALEDPNPEAYRQALERMAGTESLFKISPEQRYRPEPKRVVQMALEVDEISEPVLEALDELVEKGELGWILELLSEADASDASERLWNHVATADRLADVARMEPLDTDALDGIVAHMGIDAAPPMFDVLAESESGQTRRLLVGRLAGLGPGIGVHILERLSDDRWFVVRNLLGILGELGDLPDGFDGTEFLKHPDARVRREGMKVMVKLPSGRERAISQAIADEDQQTVRLGLTAALEGCPDTVVPQVVMQATSGSTGDIRVLAVRVLAACGHTMAREALFEIAAPRRSLFGTKLPAKSPELLATITAMRRISDDPRAQRILRLASKSRDDEVAAAAAEAGGS